MNIIHNYQRVIELRYFGVNLVIKLVPKSSGTLKEFQLVVNPLCFRLHKIKRLYRWLIYGLSIKMMNAFLLPSLVVIKYQY